MGIDSGLISGNLVVNNQAISIASEFIFPLLRFSCDFFKKYSISI